MQQLSFINLPFIVEALLSLFYVRQTSLSFQRKNYKIIYSFAFLLFFTLSTYLYLEFNPTAFSQKAFYDIVMICYFKFILNNNIKRAIYEYLLYITVAIILILSVFNVYFFLIPNFLDNVNYVVIVHISTFIISILLFKFTNIITFIRHYDFYKDGILVVLLSIRILSYFGGPSLYSSNQSLRLIYFIFFLIILLDLFFIKIFVKKSEKLRKIENYKTLDKTSSEYLNDIRSRQHDFRNHLATIYSIAKMDFSINSQKIQTYIENLHEDLKKVDVLVATESNVLNSILYLKQNEAKRKEIDFHFIQKASIKDFPFADYEFTEILSNLIDNAIEALECSTIDNKVIIIEIYKTTSQSIIKVSNTSIKLPIENLDDLMCLNYTTKNESGTHGYGLYNVKKIIDSHKGKIEVVYENNMITFKIILNNATFALQHHKNYSN